MLKAVVLPFLLIGLCSIGSYARVCKTDTTVTNKEHSAIQLYQRFLFHERGLYNGTEYVSYVNSLYKAHPYYLNDEFVNGSIFYDGVLYEDVPLQYDIIKQVLVIRDPYEKFKLQLINEKLGWFSINHINFMHLLAENIPAKSPIKPGFYHTIYAGRTSLLKKENKSIQEKLEFRLVKYVQETPVFYIKKAGLYYLADSKSAVLDIFKDKKTEIRQFIRQNELDISVEPERSLMSIVAYYDKLTQ